MQKTCPRPCPHAQRHARDMQALRSHLLESSGCTDTWVALAAVLTNPQHRLDCWQRAAMLEPEDDQIQEQYLQCRLEVDPNDQQARDTISQRNVERALQNYRAKIFLRMRPTRSLGEILVEMGAITEAQLDRALERQRSLKRSNKGLMLGDILVEMKLVTPAMLARALITQHQDRSEKGESPQALGEYLVAHGYISVQSLERALIEQTRLRQGGEKVSIGKVLLRLNMIDNATLTRALSQQTNDAFNSFR